ncbi:MAG: hypothetical protein KBB55_02785 [Candidatus Buchananbacteria bacterium]|nr:hypothetical protein [Candidatus Buchananbacteria bacterium]
MFLLQILVGLIGVAVGVLMVWKPWKFLELIGEQAWMEKAFGAGHGTTGYQALGLIIIVISFIVMTGMIQGLIGAIFNPLLGGLT